MSEDSLLVCDPGEYAYADYLASFQHLSNQSRQQQKRCDAKATRYRIDQRRQSCPQLSTTYILIIHFSFLCQTIEMSMPHLSTDHQR